MNRPDVVTAWAAGFFDGEGCVYITEALGLYVMVTQKRRGPLDLLSSHWGGLVRVRQVEPHQAHEWRLFGWGKALDFLVDIQPYLIAKKDQVDLVVEVASLGVSTRGRHLTSEVSDARRLARRELQRMKRIVDIEGSSK